MSPLQVFQEDSVAVAAYEIMDIYETPMESDHFWWSILSQCCHTTRMAMMSLIRTLESESGGQASLQTSVCRHSSSDPKAVLFCKLKTKHIVHPVHCPRQSHSVLHGRNPVLCRTADKEANHSYRTGSCCFSPKRLPST